MATIKDVAREAGVSVGTDSQALRDSPVVREATRRRVLAVAKRLRYKPSALARGLVTRRTHTVGLPVCELGREAMRLLLEQMGSNKRRRPQRGVLKPELLVRESCGPPPAGPASSTPRRTRAHA